VSKPCSICIHKNRCRIDEDIFIMRDIAAVARKYRVSEDALGRHVNKGHIPKAIESAANEKDVQTGLNIQKCAQEIYNIATGSAKEARAESQFSAVGSCLGPATKVLDILSRGEESKPPPAPKESGFFSSYIKRAEEVYEKKT